MKEQQNVKLMSDQVLKSYFNMIVKLDQNASKEVFESMTACAIEDKKDSDNFLKDEEIKRKMFHKICDLETMISCSKLNLLIDLYHHYPYIKRKDKNLSEDLYYIMSSNKASKPLQIAYNPPKVEDLFQSTSRSKSLYN